jgi:hypothetical protein
MRLTAVANSRCNSTLINCPCNGVLYATLQGVACNGLALNSLDFKAFPPLQIEQWDNSKSHLFVLLHLTFLRGCNTATPPPPAVKKRSPTW